MLQGNFIFYRRHVIPEHPYLLPAEIRKQIRCDIMAKYKVR